jgi:hypothetical protein
MNAIVGNKRRAVFQKHLRKHPREVYTQESRKIRLHNSPG